MENLDFQWLDFKIDQNNKDLVKEINELKIAIKKLDHDIMKLKQDNNKNMFLSFLQDLHNHKIDIMDLEN
jgi:hypothetical protein